MKKIVILLVFFTTQGVSARNLRWGTDDTSYYQSVKINRAFRQTTKPLSYSKQILQSLANQQASQFVTILSLNEYSYSNTSLVPAA